MITIRMLVIFTCFCFSLLFPSLKAFGEGDGIPSVAYLEAMNDVIVVGEGSLESSNEQSATIAINLERVIKGDNIPQSIRIVRATTSPMCIVPKDSQPVNAIWFLRHLPDGSIAFGLTPKSQVCQPLENEYEVPNSPLPSRWSNSSSVSPKLKLAYELAASLEANEGTGPPIIFTMGPFILNAVDSAINADVYKKLSESSIKTVRLIGILGLVQNGDSSQLKDVLDGKSELTFESPWPRSYKKKGKMVANFHYDYSGKVISTYRHAIIGSLSYVTNGDDSVVQRLGDLLESPSLTSEDRRAIGKALMNIHTPLAVTFLAPLLEDEDPQLRTDAIGGLALFANNIPIIDHRDPTKPSVIRFDLQGPYKTPATVEHCELMLPVIARNEGYYLSFWKEWWSANGAAITASARAGQ
jgi:hypothetical protein